MGRYKIIDENGIYFTTHTIVEWLPLFTHSMQCGKDFRGFPKRQFKTLDFTGASSITPKV